MSGIKIFFSSEASLDKFNEALEKHNFHDRIGKNSILILTTGTFTEGLGGIQFYYKKFSGKGSPLYGGPYEWIVWIKNLDGKTLWQNYNYDECGLPK